MKTKTRLGVGGLVTMLALGVGGVGARAQFQYGEGAMMDQYHKTGDPADYSSAVFFRELDRGKEEAAQQERMKQLLQEQTRQIQQQQQVQPVVVYQEEPRDKFFTCYDFIDLGNNGIDYPQEVMELGKSLFKKSDKYTFGACFVNKKGRVVSYILFKQGQEVDRASVVIPEDSSIYWKCDASRLNLGSGRYSIEWYVDGTKIENIFANAIDVTDN